MFNLTQPQVASSDLHQIYTAGIKILGRRVIFGIVFLKQSPEDSAIGYLTTPRVFFQTHLLN